MGSTDPTNAINPNNVRDSKNAPNPINSINAINSKDAKIVSCPQCGSAKLRRSHSRGPYEKLQKLFNQQRAYRCKDCGWRGLIKTKSHKSRTTPSRKGYSWGRLIFVAVLLLIAIYLLIYLVKRAQ